MSYSSYVQYPDSSSPTAVYGVGSDGSQTYLDYGTWSGLGSPAPTVQYANPATQSAYQLMQSTLQQWGLSELLPDTRKFLTQGLNNDQITLALQQTDAYKTRFAANQQRIANGLPALQPAEYVALEGQYRQLMRQYQLPTGFYDQKQNTDAWIGNDVSASELSDRLKMASDAYLNADEGTKQAWDQWYGQHGPGGAIAAILDPKVAEPLLQQQVTSAGIGGAAINNGLQANQAVALQAAQHGVSIDQARKVYAGIAQRVQNDQAIGTRFGAQPQNWQSTEEQANLLGNGQAQQQLGLLYAQESGEFKGHGGASETSNSVSQSY